MIMDKGANSVRAMCTHAVFSGKAYSRIEKSVFEEVIVADTIPMKKECPKVSVLTSSRLFADVIQRVHNHESISSHYEFSTIL